MTYKYLPFAALLGVLVLAGCSSAPQETVSLDPSIRTTVTVFPIFDCRENKSIDLDKFSPNPAFRTQFLSDFYLAKFKNVRQQSPLHAHAEIPIPEDEFDSGKWSQRPEFSGDSGRYCLLTYLTDLRYTGANASIVTSLHMYLLDCEKKEIVWRKMAFQEDWLGLAGGSIERMMSSKNDSPAWKNFSATLTKCMEAFPYLKKEPPPPVQG
jgi:hypothetical protein